MQAAVKVKKECWDCKKDKDEKEFHPFGVTCESCRKAIFEKAAQQHVDSNRAAAKERQDQRKGTSKR